MKFKVKSSFEPAGDQAQAIEKLAANLASGSPHQVLLGVTGSGKTYCIAKVIEKVQKPVLIVSHNKTLAAQLYQEFKEFFPSNGVGFFVSYYDYYQPEAYMPQSDTYISKETDVNEEIDKLRLQATSLLFSRQDTIIIASVSCLYNLGSPFEYGRYIIDLKKGESFGQERLLKELISLHYDRSRMELSRSLFRVRGELVEIVPAYSDEILKVVFEGDKIASLEVRPLFKGKSQSFNRYLVYPAKHYLTDPGKQKKAFRQIKDDLALQLKKLKKEKKLLEAHRLEQRVKYDLEMIEQTGYVNGIENYSRYFDGRDPGDPPWTLIDYFNHLYKKDFLVVIDESHMSIPQMRGMYRGDRSRKKMLIDFGFRLPSSLDNRPLQFEEVLPRFHQVIYASATPADWEIKKSKGKIVEQLVRPTGLIDPEVVIRKSEGQIEDLVKEVLKRKKAKQRVLVTTLTKRMAEELASWMKNSENTGEQIRVEYLHADVGTLERTDILADLRKGKFDVVVGVNLLREGLDLPEVSLVVILDADKQGFLRSKTSLVQNMGRAARNKAGEVILYADRVSQAMEEAIREVDRRRKIQVAFNKKHGITPKSIKKPIRKRIVKKGKQLPGKGKFNLKEHLKTETLDSLTPGEKKKLIPRLKREMRQAAAALEFEKAVEIRDLIEKIER